MRARKLSRQIWLIFKTEFSTLTKIKDTWFEVLTFFACEINKIWLMWFYLQNSAKVLLTWPCALRSVIHNLRNQTNITQKKTLTLHLFPVLLRCRSTAAIIYNNKWWYRTDFTMWTFTFLHTVSLKVYSTKKYPHAIPDVYEFLSSVEHKRFLEK